MNFPTEKEIIDLIMLREKHDEDGQIKSLKTMLEDNYDQPCKKCNSLKLETDHDFYHYKCSKIHKIIHSRRMDTDNPETGSIDLFTFTKCPGWRVKER